MSQDKLFFGHAVSGLYQHALGNRMMPELREQLREAGLDLDKPLLPAYPAELFVRWLDVAGAALFPNRSRAEQLYEMGRVTVQGFAQIELGSAMFDHLKVMTAEKSMQRLERSLRAAMNFIAVRFHPLSPTEFELHLNDVVGIPDFFRGLVEGGSSAAGRSSSVTVSRLEGEGCVLLYRAG
ncbi:MAG: DUF2378 family protein [Deltaproteobacteria bacterium]|nr:DUF2378 family protein [Deltaproteobacteria bacterium]